MDQLNTFLGAISKRLYQEDSIDRLNYHYTVWLLLAFAVTLSAKQYVGEPIQCWVPAEFTGGWEQYTENYCFVENTYFAKFDENLPDNVDEREAREISYYQWVPFILALEALMFYIPHMIWRLLNWQSGIHLRGIITMACDNKNLGGANQVNAVADIAGHMHACIEIRKKHYGNQALLDSILQCGRSGGVYLSLVYLFTKILFITNLILQFIILNEFLGTSYTFWGASILRDILRNHEWQLSGHFPRVTLCDFEVRKLGNMHRYTVQCVLMINMFSEKIFLFIWWWFMVVVIVTILNFFYWLFVISAQNSRHSYIQKLLFGFQGGDDEPAVTGTQAAYFADYIGPDAVLVLRLMSNNAGELMAGRVCKALYDRKLKDDAEKRKATSKKNDAITPDYSHPPRHTTTIEKVGPTLTNV